MMKILKNNTTLILKMSLILVAMVTGSCATGSRVTLQGRTIYTSTGQRLMLEHLISDRPTGYFTTFGKPVRLINDPTGCAILRTDVQVFHSWHHLKLLTRQQPQRIQDLVYYPKAVVMLKNVYRQGGTNIHQLPVLFQTNTRRDGTTKNRVILQNTLKKTHQKFLTKDESRGHGKRIGHNHRLEKHGGQLVRWGETTITRT